MNNKFRMMLLITLFVTVSAHSFDATVRLPELQANNGWVYLHSFPLVPHLARLQLTLNVEGHALTQQPQSLVIQGVPASEWEQEYDHKCTSVLRMPVVMQELKMDGTVTAGIFQFALTAAETYYFVLKDCHQLLRQEYDNSHLAIRIRMEVLSNEIDPAFEPKEEEIRIVEAADEKKAAEL